MTEVGGRTRHKEAFTEGVEVGLGLSYVRVDYSGVNS